MTIEQEVETLSAENLCDTSQMRLEETPVLRESENSMVEPDVLKESVLTRPCQ